ncbi:MAG: restriction endonuclease subunit S [Trichocoleus desertorum ATA4-8-CV12]|jgi:type I restriction enzyme S subunit|nr:restriction endonuclease subunit S [Trichocoleus desertorum ATA4-8-CV12]
MSDELTELPDGWIWTDIKSIASVITGKTPSTSNSAFWEGDIPFVTPSQIDPSGRMLLPNRTLTQLGAAQARIIPENSTLAVCIGTVGKIGLLNCPSVINQQLNALVPAQIVSAHFLYYWSQYFLRSWIIENASATVNAAILNKSRLETAPVVLPPVNEQKRIVAKIEELRDRYQRAKQALEQAHQLEHLLVAHYTTSWDEGKLGNHIEARNELAGDYWYKYPVVGLSNEGCITERREPLGEKSAPKCKVIRSGDIVFNPIRFSIGSIARYRKDEPAIVSPEYQVFQTKGTMSSELLCRYLRSRSGQSRLEIETQGSVRYRVYLRNLQQLVMPIAPPELQAEAEQFFLCLNRTFEWVDQAITKIPQLEQAILAKAFRGELVEQDPNDEPASVLLDCIRAEREKADNGKKTKGKRAKQLKLEV